MALTVRQKAFFFVGLNLAIYGLALSILGAWGTFYWVHGAAGASMWCGLVLIMCGAWNIVIAVDQDAQKATGEISLSGILVNMVAVFLGMAIIGFSTWASWNFLDRGIIYGADGTERQIELYVTVVLLGVFSFILGMVALLADCCCGGAFFGPGIQAGPAPAVAGYPAQVPQQINYGYPQF